MTTPTTREQQLAERIAQLRAKHPMLGDSYWEGVEREQRLQWQVDDLTNGVAELAGRYGWHAGQNPDNTLLAQLVAELRALVGLSTGDGGEVMYGYVDLPDVQDGTNCRGCRMTRRDCEFVDLGEDPELARCCDTCSHGVSGGAESTRGGEGRD